MDIDSQELNETGCNGWGIAHDIASIEYLVFDMNIPCVQIYIAHLPKIHHNTKYK